MIDAHVTACNLASCNSSYHRVPSRQMKEEERKRLTWEDATQRFLEVAELGPKDRQSPLETAVDAATWKMYNNLVGANAEPAVGTDSSVGTLSTQAPSLAAAQKASRGLGSRTTDQAPTKGPGPHASKRQPQSKLMLPWILYLYLFDIA